ncbi:putative receptor-like protein kinase At5g39000 isoform X2 [Henckelia pumila]
MLASSVQIKGKSTISSVKRGSVSVSARVSPSGFSYVFLVSPGEKFIRLHFNPAPYKGFQKYKDLFTVEAAPFTLLTNFSASLTFGLTSVIKEFCINVEENQPLHIVFTPATSLSGDDTYAFLNGIEIFTVPSGHSYFHAYGDIIGAQVIGRKSQHIYVDNSTALEMVRRVNLKRSGSVSSGDDIADIFGLWGTVHRVKANQINNITWEIPVDVGFRYLIRLYFSNLGLKFVQVTGSESFQVLIDEVTAYNNIDLASEKDTDNAIVCKDYIVMLKERKHNILVSLQSYGESVDGYGPFTGFEMLKLSNHDNSLASPNPSPLALDSPSSTVQILSRVLGKKYAVVTFLMSIIVLADVIVYKLREIWEDRCTEEEIKPSARAQRFCRRFTLSEIQLATKKFSHNLVVGKGGFGNVFKGLIDNGKEIVAVKRLKFDSRQGAHEFLAEIETLSELRHNNIVSLIGYCTEQREMILVYEYLARGTLGDHLYKLVKKGISCGSLTWKQRLNICIGAGRGLDYLHTGHGIIHRDFKVSNIMLDENFTAKVSDFGLVKHENLRNSQSHVSTKVKGTFGYLDPNYTSTGKLTRKSDTYAFGVVLLEVLCGRPVIDQQVPEDEQILTNWARGKIREGEVELIVDSNLRKEISPNSLKAFVEIAERCVDEEPKKRPTMTQVVLQLEHALEQQDILEPPLLKDITIDAPCSCYDEINLSVGEQAILAPSILEPSTSPPTEQTYRGSDYEIPPCWIKEGRKAPSNKLSRIRPWDGLWKTNLRRNEDRVLSEIYSLGINLPEFDWGMFTLAIDVYSYSHKVGRSAKHTAVYKAAFTKHTVAVRRVSDARLFINEIFMDHRLRHHRNIIKLLGYCIDEESMLLVHEFMENNSVGGMIFDGKFHCVQWPQRFKIIMGIARGVAYLHQDSGMSIIHGDLTGTNILLDINMNPKISGFGFAKTLEEYRNESKTITTVGTRCYIAPECHTLGKFSMKTDVYSFGVVVLDIVSGKRCFDYVKHIVPIVSQTRMLWREDRALEVVDDSLGGHVLSSMVEEEVLRCIKVGLLCTLRKPDVRPTMHRAIKLLEGEEYLDWQEVDSLLRQERDDHEP